ncbi:lipase [Trametes elegans]|nr:lipase [Trametes elegans]
MAPCTFASRRLQLAAAALLGFGQLLSAAPAAGPDGVARRQSITALSNAQIGSFTPFTHYASAGYCAASATRTWSCGANCEANPQFIPTASGGDGDDVQFWFVGFDPVLNSVIVAHQGTKPSDIVNLLTDGDIVRSSLDSSLFPGLSSAIGVHDGFQDDHADTAPDVLQAVQQTINEHGTNSVVVTGHSLGAALGLLDAIFLPLHIPNIDVKFIGYGLPRVGNQAFADYVDAQPISVTHVNNEEDIVPILPGKFLGYHHPSGEVHIQDSGAWLACPGQDNPSDECIVGDVSTIFDGSTSFHDGPYNGVKIGC